MSRNIRPLLSALRRSPVGAILVALEVAIALAVLVNSACIVQQRLVQIDQPTGIAPHDMFEIEISGYASDFHTASAIREDLAYLRGLPGVVGAEATLGVPLSDDGTGTGIWRQPGQRGVPVSASELPIDELGLRMLGVPLLAGRNFRSDEIQLVSKGNLSPAAPEIIVTRSAARALFPRGNALGKTVYDDAGRPMTIIGIVRDFIGPLEDNPIYNVVMFPQTPAAYQAYYLLVRTRPGRARTIMAAASRQLAISNPDRVVFSSHLLSHYKRQMDAENRNMALFLTAVTGLILAVTCLGIFGLTTFNVSSRTKQIGTLRAVGARRRDVVAHFLLESAIILTAGILIGCLLALAIGYWLTMQYQLPRLNLSYLAVGAAGLAAIGLIAAWQPARRAATVAPSVATRTA